MSKKLGTTAIRTTQRAIFAMIAEIGMQPARALATLINRPKSSIYRYLQALVRRNRHPESVLWETEAGATWLRLLVFAVLYTFGLQCHVGAETLSVFFTLIRIDTHVGVSDTALLTQLRQMEALLPVFQQQCEASIPSQTRKSVLAADETFFGKIMILVLMDLSSGYLLLESIQDDRSFDTWFAQAEPRLKALGIEVNHAISDRAKALIKLAVTGFGCTSGADLFHEQYGFTRWLASLFGRRKSKADKHYEEVENTLKTKSSKMSPDEKSALESQLNSAKEACAHVEQVQQEYREHVNGIAEEVHPFSSKENIRTTADSVATGLEKRAKALETLAEQEGVADTRSTIRKFRSQITALSSHIGVWWLWVENILLEFSVDAATQQWLTKKLLPVLYWHHQMQATQNGVSRKRYCDAWQRAVRDWHADPFRLGLSASELARWLEWGEWMVRQFHRSSSAVEGRNGRLSQLYHNGRGLTKNRLAALTVIHNYGLRRDDGTTAAERMFNSSFPNLFDWLVSQMGELPLPRKARQQIEHNPLILKCAPA